MADTFPVITMVDNMPTFEKPINEILSLCKMGGAIKILDPVERITEGQRKWYKGVCLPHLQKQDENKESLQWWDLEVKRQCDGLALLKRDIHIFEDGVPRGRLTTNGVGVRNMTKFIENILSKSVEKGWGLTPPDREFRV